MPKISIITATYNSEKFIDKTYRSILNQSITDWEWLITDDCSTDETRNILLKLKSNDSRIKIFHNEVNSGAAVSRNCSINNSSGEYLAFIDSDDLWMESKLEEQIIFMEDNQCDFSFTGYHLMSEEGLPLNKSIDIDKIKRTFNYRDILLKKATLGCSTVMLKRNAFTDLMMPNIRTGQDYALWLKLLKQKRTAALIDRPLMKYRIVTNSISRNKLKKAKRQWCIYRDIERLPLSLSLYCFVSYAIRAIIR